MRSCFNSFIWAMGVSENFCDLLILFHTVWFRYPHSVWHFLICIRKSFTNYSKDISPRNKSSWALPCTKYYGLSFQEKTFIIHRVAGNEEVLPLSLNSPIFLRIHLLLNMFFWSSTASLKERLISCLENILLSFVCVRETFLCHALTSI